jgi:hypothetical protein
MITHARWLSDAEKERYSDLQVLSTPAGYYVGTTYTEDGFTEPGGRDSEYYRTFEEANAFLALLETLSPAEAIKLVRMTP